MGNPPNANLRERMQIGRQLKRTKPKLDKEGYSDELKDLISFSLDSDPRSRPTMADILKHSFIAGTEESHPTSSLGELVQMYYQWSQRGGQRISLFNPGGAAAAEFPNQENTFEGDWNFSTTDGFEQRFSVINLDELAASLAELEDQINPTTEFPERESLDEPRETEMSTDDKANFDERVRRGATAMEGLFDEEKPDYKYETKNDFVPVEQRRPQSDLPLRTDTDRSSVMSTFIDIDIGSFDSSHYAAATTTAQPIQLADADTIKANRSSGRQQRNSNDARSRSSSGGLNDNQDLTFQPQTGPRPPTMDWKFPGFMQAPKEEESESKPEGDATPEAKPTELEQPDKRATMEWTFPMMGAPAEEAQPAASADPSRFETLKAPLVEGAVPTETIRPISIGEPGDARPSTSASDESSFTVSSDADYDPFRLDRPTSPSGLSVSTHQREPNFGSDFPEIIDLNEGEDEDDDEPPIILDGPGPDEEDDDVVHEDDHDATATTTPSWHVENNTNTGPSHHRISQSEPFPTAIPTREFPSFDTTRLPTGTPGDTPVSDSDSPLPTARHYPRSLPKHRDVETIQFPDLVPPSVESLVAGADEGVLMGEMDRLLGDFLDALSATGEALSKKTANVNGSGGIGNADTTESMEGRTVTPEMAE